MMKVPIRAETSEKINYFNHVIHKKSYRNVYRKLSAKCECHDEDLFLEADRALSRLNFLFHLK